MYSYFVSLYKLIPRYLILFVATVNGIDSLISLLIFSLLVCRNASDFYVLIFFPEILLNSLISSSNFMILSLGFSMYNIMSSKKYFFSDMDSFHFFFFSAVARTSRTMLNNSGESGYPCLVPELSYNAFSFSPLRIIFAEAYHIWPLLG